MKTLHFPPVSALLLAVLACLPGARGADPTPTEAPLRELGASPTSTAAASPAAAVAPTPTPTPELTPTPTPTPTSSKHRHYHGAQNSDDDGNRVAVGDEAYVGANETVTGNAVAVFGPLSVDGTVDGNAVEVFGDGRIDGTVHGDVVSVMGSLRLGSHAHVEGEVTTVFGDVEKEAGAVVDKGVHQQGSTVDWSDNSGTGYYFRHGLGHLRPLVFGHHTELVWFWVLGCLALYVLITHMFPKGVEKCADTLAHRPGLTILTGVLGVIAVPIIWILLAITVVGIFVVPIAVFCTVLYGRAAINYLIGRPLVGKISPPALATLLGGLIICLFYLIPFVGFLVVALLNFLGFAAAITTMLAPAREAVAVRPAPVAPVVAPVAPPPAQGLEVPAAAAAVAPVIPVMVEPPVIPASVEPPAFVPPVVPPPVIPPVIPVAPAGIPPVAAAVALPGAEYLLPRATFWIRMTALLIDLVIVAIVAHGSGAFCLVALAGYAAIMWKYKGTTLGGIILGLKVVRVDGRPVDWPTAIVRALACFISLFVAGLGFIWIAIDPDRQGWHDRIAGTVVVRLPKAQPLV